MYSKGVLYDWGSRKGNNPASLSRLKAKNHGGAHRGGRGGHSTEQQCHSSNPRPRAGSPQTVVAGDGAGVPESRCLARVCQRGRFNKSLCLTLRNSAQPA